MRASSSPAPAGGTGGRRRRTSFLAALTLATAVTGVVVGGPARSALAACTPTDSFGSRGLFPTSASGGALSAGAGFGSALAIADFNGDGTADVAVGAPGDLVNGVAAGAVYVFPGSASGLGTGIRLTQTDVGAGNEAGDKFGASLAAADVNHDGYADLAVGIPGEAVGSNAAAGAIAFFPGGPGGLTTGKWLSQTLGGGGNEAGDQFGYALAAADFDGDGYAEVAIGVPGEAPSGGTVHGGVVYVYKGSASGLVRGWSFDQDATGAGATESGDQFGYALAAGNVTGDGHPDLVVGTPGEGPSGDPANSGAIYVLPSGKTPGFARSQSGIGGNEAGDRMGSSVATGNFDGDGYADVAVGVPGEAPAGGSVIVFPGASSQVATGFWLNENRAGEPIVGGDRFGASVAAGNVDGDGYADLLVGAPGANSTAGAAYLFGGRPRQSSGTRSLERGHRLDQPDLGWGNESGDRWGSAVALGDFQGDSTADAVIGDAGEAPAGTTTHSGAAETVTGLVTGLSLGPIAGGAGTTRTTVWVRGNHAGTLQVEYRPVGTTTWTAAPETGFGGADVDYTATVAITGLTPGTPYDLRASVGCRVDHLQLGGFQTLPDASATSLTWAYGADTRQYDALNSDGTERQSPFQLFDAAGAVNPAFMILDGDQVYADANGFTPQVAADYYPTYRQNWGQTTERRFLRNHASFMMWDDHEILNDWDSGQTGVYPEARKAYQVYQGSHNPAPYRPGVLYYAFRAGPADFFVMDLRSYRSDEALADTSTKTMLGAQQLADVETWLKNSTAPFKFLISSDPFANMNCDLTTPKHDSWCGYRTERQKLWDFIVANNITGVIGVSGDHHWSGAFKADNTTAKIYEFMPNPLGINPATAPSSASDMLWHYATPQEVYGLFHINGNTLTMTMRGASNTVLRTFTVDTAGNLTQS